MREAQSKRENPLDIRKQLEEIIEAEDAAPLNKALRLRKKVLQEAYDAALKRKKVSSFCPACIRILWIRSLWRSYECNMV